EHDVDRFKIGRNLENLRSDVRVQADEVHALGPRGLEHGGLGLTRGDWNSELGVQRARLPILVGVCLDPRADSEQRGNTDAEALPKCIEATQLVEVVHHEAADAQLSCELDLFVRLVVSMEV